MLGRHPSRLLYAASLASLSLLPVVLWQGLRLRRTRPRLPDAQGDAQGQYSEGSRPLRLLVLGESTVAGVGAGHHGEALAGQLGQSLEQRLGRAVAWRAAGKSGADLRWLRRHMLPALAAEPEDCRVADALLLVVGVNDVLAMSSPGHWQGELAALIADLRAVFGPLPVFIAAIPPLGRFPALPQPLRGILGLRASLLDQATRRLLPHVPFAWHLPAALPPHADLFCADGFHPSPAGYRLWAEQLAPQLADKLASPLATQAAAPQDESAPQQA